MAPNYLLPDKAYDIIKYVVTILLPAITVAYVALAATWGWPMSDQIEQTLVVLYTFLCSAMGISTLAAKRGA